MSALAARVRALVEDAGLQLGTHPENLAAWRLHQAGHSFTQQYRVGRYRLDIAWPDLKIALEIDGPHHHRPDVAHQDALRDARLRQQGWVILRVNTDDTFEDQLATVSRLMHSISGGGRAGL